MYLKNRYRRQVLRQSPSTALHLSRFAALVSRELNHERARDRQDVKYVIDRSHTLPAIEVRAKELEQSCIETKELDTILGNFIMHRSIYRISLLAFVPGTMFDNRSRLDCIFCFCSDRTPQAAIAILRGRRLSRLDVSYLWQPWSLRVKDHIHCGLWER